MKSLKNYQLLAVLKQPTAMPAKLLIVAVLWTTFFIANSSVQAQSISNQELTETAQDFALTVHPPVSYVYVKPSEKLKHTLIVKNEGQKSLRISVNVTDFKADGETGRPVLQPGRIFNKEVNPDLLFGEPFTLPAGRSHSINLQFDVADVIHEKEYPLAVLINARSLDQDDQNQNSFAGSSPQTSQQSSQAKVAGTVVSNLIVYIGDDDSNQGKIELTELKMPRLIDSFSGIRFSLLAKNKGRTADLIQGRAIIHNIFKHTISEYVFYPDFILANATRMIRGTESTPELFDNEGLLDPEKVETLTTQFFYKPPLLIGPYQIHFELADQQFSETVIALPFSIIAAIGIGFILHYSYKHIVHKLKF